MNRRHFFLSSHTGENKKKRQANGSSVRREGYSTQRQADATHPTCWPHSPAQGWARRLRPDACESGGPPASHATQRNGCQVGRGAEESTKSGASQRVRLCRASPPHVIPLTAGPTVRIPRVCVEMSKPPTGRAVLPAADVFFSFVVFKIRA